MKRTHPYGPLRRLMLSALFALILAACGAPASQTGGSTTQAPATTAEQAPAATAATDSSPAAATAEQEPVATADADASPAAVAAPSGDPIKVGATLALTGSFGETGQWIERAYKYWEREINANGGLLGRPVEVIVYDDGGSVEEATNLMERLITVDQVDMLLGGYPGPSAAAQMALAERSQKVYISMGGHMKSFEQGYGYSFGAPPIMGQWWYNGVWEWLETLPADQRPKKAAVVTMNNPIGAAVMENVNTGLQKLNIELVVDEKYDLPLADATLLIAKAKSSGADLFIANGTFPDGVITVQAMKSLDYNPAMFVQAIGSIIPSWTKELGEDGNYVLSGTAISDQLPFEGLAELNTAVQEEFDVPSTPQYFLFGYAWAQTLQQAVEGAGSLDQNVIRDYLKANEISTIAGNFTFDEKGLPEPYAFATQIIDGKPELIWPADVRTSEPVFPKPNWNK
jgi:branched-chain amino acid transport system substrate-binding protein